MSGASEAVEALKGVAQEAYQATFVAGTQLARAHSALRQKADLVEVLQAAIDTVMAAEALQQAADQAVKALRATLAAQMDATGCTKVETTHHSGYLSKRPAFVSIDDESALPPEFVVQKPSIDKRAIASAIKDGITVAGASLLTPNEPVLVLRARKEAAQ